MKRWRTLAALSLGLWLGLSGLTAQASASAPIGAIDWAGLFQAPAELRRIGSLAEPLPYPELLRTALLASGLPEEELDAGAASLGILIESTVAALPRTSSEAELAEAALHQLHESGILGAYEAEATTITGILETGRFNCVSSAVLYLLILKRLGIEAIGVRTLDHAFCLVRADGREIDVETTNPYGFDPGRRQEFTDEFGTVTGFSYVPPGAYDRRWNIGERELVSLILSNRASTLETRGRFAESLRLGVAFDALRGGDREGRDFLIDRVNNLAAELGRRRDFLGTDALLLAAETAYGPEPRLEALGATAAYNRAAVFAEAGQWEAALAEAERVLAEGRGGAQLQNLAAAMVNNIVQAKLAAKDASGARTVIESHRELLGEEAARRLLGKAAELELEGILRNGAFAEARAAVQKAVAEGSIAPRRAGEFLVYLYGTEANRLGQGGDWLAAAALAQEGARLVPEDRNLARAAEAFRKNFIAEAHNRFAALYNNRRYAEAKAAVEEALLRLPGDKTLEEDLRLAKRALGQ